MPPLNPVPISGLSYDDVTLLFRAAGLPHSRSHVTRALRTHARICPAIRVSYKTVRFDADKVQALIERLCKPWKEAA